jgi:hypothetical protein
MTQHTWTIRRKHCVMGTAHTLSICGPILTTDTGPIGSRASHHRCGFVGTTRSASIHRSQPSLQVHFIGCARQRRHVQIGAAHPPHIRLPLGTAQPTVILSSAHTFGSRSSITVQAAQKWHPLALTHRLVVQSHLFDQLYTWLPMGALMRCTSQASASTLLSL